ncbi:transporter, partial [Staphylococcus saprophyticus]
AVQHPDIYKMKDTDRVKQLVDKAILLKDADLSSVNLAEKLQDQKVIYIPKIGDKDQKDINMNHFALKNNHTEDSKKGNSTINSEQININDATESQLLTINGIGPTKAKAIIEYRQQHGPFESVEQLKDVNGIGAKTLEKIGSKLTI